MLTEDCKNKLSRKGKIYEKLRSLTQSIAWKNQGLSENIGFDTNYISEQIGIARNNVSKELNRLLEEGRAIKILGKPVLYLDRVWLESDWKLTIKEPIIKNSDELRKMITPTVLPYSVVKQERSFINQTDMDSGIDTSSLKKTIFKSIIGAEDDLKTQVKQAKAAILYPPLGLHTLLMGATGTGKTTFAEIMYRYALEIGKLKAGAPYVIFNCADYAENPQLLISHLFGHAKGAFTGADTEKKGLIDQANGGILFLDEVHRLPPEGQEMLFSLMDRGSYRRLGESESVRKANILIIAATTEDPKDAILGTFLRRIPVVITLPSLSERSLKGRMMLICQFFREESVKIRIPVTVAKEVMKVLLLYKCAGNIGQLRNDIQLMCATAFVEYATETQDYVHVKLSQISQRLREGFFTIDSKRQELTQNFNLNDFESITFNGIHENLHDNLKDVLLYDEYRTEEDFYDLILESAQKFYEEGLSIKQIRENINQEIKNRFHNYLPQAKSKKLTFDKEILSKIVTPEIVEIVRTSLMEAAEGSDICLNIKVIYSLALHIETLIERLRLAHITIYPQIEKVYREHPHEYAVAQRIKVKLEEKLLIQIPNDEIAFIAMLLYSVNVTKEDGNIGVLVITHGYATATNMVQVAKTLLGCDDIHALDMPLEEKVEVALDRATEMVKQINKGSGVLLLVDMGSLTTFSEIISERTGIPTRTVKMVSTPMVIEAARKATMPDINLDMLIDSVNNMSSLIGERIKVNNPPIEIDGMRIDYQERALVMLEEILTFLNVKKAFKFLNEVLEKIVDTYGKRLDDSIKIKFLFHCSCMIERMIRKEPLSYGKFSIIKREKETLFSITKDNFTVVQEAFDIDIPDTELAYIVEMLDTHFQLFVPLTGEFSEVYEHEKM